MSGEPSCFHSLAERMQAFRDADLYPVVTSEFCNGRDPFDMFRMIAEAGARLIQIREKNMDAATLCDLVRRCRSVANRTRTLLIVDDRLDVALAANADGVHLGQEDLPIRDAKRIAPDLIIGTSTHNLSEIERAVADGTDYLNVGPIFPTQTKSVSCIPIGIEQLKLWIPKIPVPFTVMGGIKERHVPQLLELGVRRIAMVTCITQSADPVAETKNLLAYWRP